MLDYDRVMGWILSEKIWFRTTLTGDPDRTGTRVVHWKGYTVIAAIAPVMLGADTWIKQYYPPDGGVRFLFLTVILFILGYIFFRHHETVDLRNRPKSPETMFPKER